LRWKKNSSADLRARAVRERKRWGPAVSGSRERRGACPVARELGRGEGMGRAKGGKAGRLGLGKNEGMLGYALRGGEKGSWASASSQGLSPFPFYFFSFSKSFSKRVFFVTPQCYGSINHMHNMSIIIYSSIS